VRKLDIKTQAEIIVIERGVKSAAMRKITNIYHGAQQSGRFVGMTKQYTPKDDDGEIVPTETRRVQTTVQKEIEAVFAVMSEWLDVAATRDVGNCVARADLVLNGTVLLKQVPVHFLLFLEKQLTDLRTFIAALPVLDPAEAWFWDEEVELYKTAPRVTTRSVTKVVPLVLLAPTDKHPGQAQTVKEQIQTGTFLETKMSGAIKESAQQLLLRRVDELYQAVQVAREVANKTHISVVKAGDVILDYIFKGKEPATEVAK